MKTTIGLIRNHANLKRPAFVSVKFEINENDTVTLTALSAHDLSPIRAIKKINISYDEYLKIPHNPNDDTVTALFVMNKLGLY
jgi:hypothetical protein